MLLFLVAKIDFMEQPKMRIDLKDATWVECSKGNKIFEAKLLFKRVSPLISPTGKEEFIPLETIVCTTCGKIPKFFYDQVKDIPEELKSDCEK